MPKIKLTPQQAAEIRRLHKQGMQSKAIAYAYGVSNVCIHHVVVGTTFKYVGDGFTHWLIGDLIACNSGDGDVNLVDYSEQMAEVDCPDCLRIKQLVGAVLEAMVSNYGGM